MKKLVIGAIALMVSMGVTFAQGQFNFNNKVNASGVNARVLDLAGAGATSPTYSAGALLDSGGTLTFLPGSATTFKSTPAAATGYINPLVVTVPGQLSKASVTVRMIGWMGDATDAAGTAAITGVNKGISNPVTVVLGGGTDLPPDMVGLQGFTITPEPSTIAFGLLGAAALLIRRRK